MPELSLAPALLSPGNAAKLSAAPQSLQPPAALLSAIESLYNPSQLAAIRAALCGRGVSLIQHDLVSCAHPALRRDGAQTAARAPGCLLS